MDPRGEDPIETDDALVVAFYLLLRDHVQPAAFEAVALSAEQSNTMPEPGATLTNAYLAGYAANLAFRLRQSPTEEMVAAAALSLYRAGNKRLGLTEEERPYAGEVEDAYRAEAQAALIAGLGATHDLLEET
jgi:hypothetical protein